MPETLKPDKAMEERIIAQGCYDKAENQRIYTKWFAKGPRYQFQNMNRKYQLSEKTICDIGCGYGMNLLYCKPDSYGIEVDKYPVNFARSIGLTVHDTNFIHDSVDDLPKVDAVWCSAVLEHVESIHIFLRKISVLLKPNGLVFVYVPTIPLIPAFRHLPVLKTFTTGYLFGDHVNAFTPSTLRFFCERAGFEMLDLSPCLPPPFALINHIPLMNRLVGAAAFVGRKIPNWDYPKDASRRATETGKGFEYKSSFSDGSAR